ncbi:hypothetical protein D3C75_1126360 [compost metagenome]
MGVGRTDCAGNGTSLGSEYHCCLRTLQGNPCLPGTQYLSLVFCHHHAVQRRPDSRLHSDSEAWADGFPDGADPSGSGGCLQYHPAAEFLPHSA